MRFTCERVGLDEVVVDAEEAFHAVEGADLLDGVLVTLGVRLLLGSISPEVEEGEAGVEEVGHGGLWWPPGVLWLRLSSPRRRLEGSAVARAG